jgi:hypothetical protein
MNCNNCESILVSAIEEHAGLCSSCIPLSLKEAFDKKHYIEKLEAENRILLNSIKILDEARERRLYLESCFENGKEAHNRKFPIEQDPYPTDSEESVMWKNGWIEAARLKECEDMRNYIRWDFELWVHIHELATNGCDLEEIRVKSSLAPPRAMQFIPELLGEDEHTS